MSNLSNVDTTDELDNAVVTINGATDNSRIGNIGDRLKVDASVSSGELKDFYLEVAKGNVPGHSVVDKFGYTPEVDSTGDIWTIAKTSYPWPTSAQTTTIVSNDNSDRPASNGAWTVEVQGLDSGYNLISEVVTLNGNSNVTLANQYLRVFRAKVLTAGSQGENDGNISINHGGTTIAHILAEYNQTLMALYTIPAGKTGYMVHWDTEIQAKRGSTTQKAAEIRLKVRSLGGVFQVKDTRLLLSDGDQVDKYKTGYLKLLEKTDIVISVNAGTVNTAATGGFEIVLVDNE